MQETNNRAATPITKERKHTVKDTIETSAGKVLAHINAEIHVREEELKQLNGARQTLAELFPDGQPAPAAVQTAGKVKKPKKEKTGGAVIPAAGAVKPSGKAPSAETVRLTVAMRSCPEPFTVESLTVATGADKKACSNVITRGFTKGWLERAGRGEYKRSASFPKETPAEV